ncbi:Uncharacterized protein PBTT_07638 [Plasmodiophora brassicae]|uniref:Uncharacterized protein n=1 Tax=Plasmodiophora brassicae TaxID=37360 RepID=A0A0G4IM72_PLABS|nr:hypothetical protein PBRA_004920 [Plasmodiophora brassicae]SPQ99183.1 unnamed protein product [Plasmodiophora brassicae]
MTGASDEGSSLCDIAELRRELLFVEYFHLLDETRALRHRLHRALADGWLAMAAVRYRGRLILPDLRDDQTALTRVSLEPEFTTDKDDEGSSKESTVRQRKPVHRLVHDDGQAGERSLVNGSRSSVRQAFELALQVVIQMARLQLRMAETQIAFGNVSQ